MVLRKHELEVKLAEDSLMIKSGVLKDDNPLDTSPEFHEFLLACRKGDLSKCQELINLGVNINGKDNFDYTPLIIASLCGHYELVQLLLEAGALAERNTFQGERCIYNALNDRIRNLLLQYDFSKSSDPNVYWSTHISTLLGRTTPQTSDISLDTGTGDFDLHKFLLAARTPYFREKLGAQPETVTLKLTAAIPAEAFHQAFHIAVRYIYLGDIPRDLVPPGSNVSEEDVAKGLDKIRKLFEIEHLWEAILAGTDRRLARQRYQDEVQRALTQVTDFFRQKVLGHKMVVDTNRVEEVRWKHDNSIFADVLLRADEPLEEHDDGTATPTINGVGIPIGPAASTNGDKKKTRKSVLYPAHKAMLIRSEYFDKMFSGDFVESKKSEHLRIVTNVACPLEHALDLLYTADMLFLDSLKNKAAVAISTLGSGTKNALVDRTHGDLNAEAEVEVEPINIYDVIHAAWDLRVQRLEEFAARYLASRLEDYIDDLDFHELIRESAERIQNREETDTIELLDDIRYYLSERFRLRFEDAGLDEIMDEDGEISPEAAVAIAASAEEATAAVTVAAVVESEKAEVKEVKVENGEDIEGAVRTLDGETADDEFASDAINYQILLNKIDSMLERLKLDA
ncbi:BTB/POZ domain-containing protein 3 [Cladobotryum mycophilum]|uniref:BTB/POZ domain-containing protein 3 n=1 Tax=Cladobotryum mycophilum TaxID=491253 RepID=A0ABR0SGH6_9HYPO